MEPNESDVAAAGERTFDVLEINDLGTHPRQDTVVVEEPIEIRIVFGPDDQRKMRSVAVTMRTPGHDRELAAGFLFTENILDNADQITGIEARGVGPDGQATGNIIRIELRPDVDIELGRLQRHFFTNSSCGVCGKASLEALALQGQTPLRDGYTVTSEVIRQLPEMLRSRQSTFERTGGLHAAGLVDAGGQLVEVREDVGRHNAVDKLIGCCFLDQRTPLHDSGMIVSGRVSFEIMQKALVAGIPLLIAVGAPSSLAVEMADEYNMTLVGFTSSRRFNIYAGQDRIRQARPSGSR